MADQYACVPLVRVDDEVGHVTALSADGDGAVIGTSLGLLLRYDIPSGLEPAGPASSTLDLAKQHKLGKRQRGTAQTTKKRTRSFIKFALLAHAAPAGLAWR